MRFKLNVLKPALAAGSYQLVYAFANAQNASFIYSLNVFTVGPAHVALSANISKVLPATLRPGRTLSFTVTLTNDGNIDAAGPATLAVYLSADGVALTVPVHAVTKRLTLKAGGGSVTLRLRVRVPAAAPAGTFYPLVTVVQGTAPMATAVAGTPVAVG